MEDYLKLQISCENPKEIIKAINAIVTQLPPEIRCRLNDLVPIYYLTGGITEVYERMNNRTVAEIIEDRSVDKEQIIIKSGEYEDLRYKLHYRSSENDEDNSGDKSE